LQKFPASTAGAQVTFGIEYRSGNEDFNEMRYITFEISETSFGISQGGSVYDRHVGSDSFSGPSWLLEIGGYRETECDLNELENSICEYLNLGARPSVACESNIEMDESDDE
jgi:hypothetical protein